MSFDPPFPVVLIGVVAALAVGVAVWREWKGSRKLNPGWFHVPALFFRVAAILTLTIILLNPSQQISTKRESSHSVILLDASRSMSLADKTGTRWEAAREFADSISKGITAEGFTAPRIATFSSALNFTDQDGLPTGKETNLAAAIEQILSGSSKESPDQIMILSDGRIHDRDRLGAALALANAAKVPLSTKVFGIDSFPRNASLVAVQAPRMVRPRSPVAVHVDVTGTGFLPSEMMNLKLTDEEGNVVAQSDFYLPEAPGGEEESKARPVEQVIVFESGLRSGQYHLELSAPGEPEVDLEDNQFSFSVEIATGKLRVLFAEGTHWKRTVGEKGHAWNDMELMTRAWEATGEIEHVSLSPWSQYLNEPNLAGVTFFNGEMLLDRTKGFPTSREELYSFDVLIVSDVSRGNFSDEQMEWVVDWVQNRGGGFLMGGGNTTFDSGKYDQTPWEKIVPVDMRGYGEGNLRQWFDIDIPESVKSHPLWTISPDPKKNEEILKAHPRFTGMNHVRRAKPGALVLAVRRGTNEPVIAAQRYGRGRSVAFMPDPNGGGGTFYLDWGPDDSPVLSANVMHIGLGHGRSFKFNEAVAKMDYGPEPSHPSPWYAQYWVNMVRWLGENSVRWQRDKMAGRVVDAQAHPGERLSVAAEVLAVSEVEELLTLNVGARLDRSGARRTRLLYDRDKREFTGELLVPGDLADEKELRVLFDVDVKGQVISEEVSVGIHRGNPEFQHSAPDPVLLADLAAASGGRILKTLQDAVNSNREAAGKRVREAQQSWYEPLWSFLWPWLVFALCFSLEWWLRRKGSQAADREGSALNRKVATGVVAALLVLGMASNVFAGQERPIEEWIAQLGADRVRLRDEAENFLRNHPEHYEAVNTLVNTTGNAETKARGRNILRYLRSHRWELLGVREIHGDEGEGMALTPGLIVNGNKSAFISRGLQNIRAWNSKTLESFDEIEAPVSDLGEDWMKTRVLQTLAVSPNTKKVAVTDVFGEVLVLDTKTGKELVRFSSADAKPFIQKQKVNPEGMIRFAAYLSDNRGLITGISEGAQLWDGDKGKPYWSSEFREPPLAMAMTPDRKKFVVSVDQEAGELPIYTVDALRGTTLSVLRASGRIEGLVFDEEGRRLLAYGDDGLARVFDFDPATGVLSNEKKYGSGENKCQGVAWGAEGSSILMTSSDPKEGLSEWELESGEILWKAPPLDFDLSNPAWIGEDRMVIPAAKGLLTIWKYTGE